MSRIMWFCELYAHQQLFVHEIQIHDVTAFERRSWIQIIRIKIVKLRLKLLWLFIIKLINSLMVLLNRRFSISPQLTILCRCSSVIYPHPLLSPSHFQNSLSTFSTERVNGIPLWDFYTSNFQRALKIIIIAELFIVMTISPG